MNIQDVQEAQKIIKMFMREATEADLMTRDEEFEVAKTIRDAQLTMVETCLNSKAAIKCIIGTANGVITSILRKDDLFFVVKDLADSNACKEDTAVNKLALYLIELCHNYSTTDVAARRAVFEKISKIRFSDKLFKRIQDTLRQEEPELANKLSILLSTIKRCKDSMIVRNMRLVVSVSKGFSNRGLDLNDVIQEGNLGLIKAVDRFDFEMGLKFSTYAHYWIRQSMGRAIAEQVRVVRLPVHVNDAIIKIVMVTGDLITQLNREPTPEELAVKTGLSLEKVIKCLRVHNQPLSIDEEIIKSDGKDGSTQGDFLADDREETNQEYVVTQSALSDACVEVFSTLDPRSEKVLRLRHGFDTFSTGKQTLDTISRILGVSRESVRQIELASYQKIKKDEEFSTKLFDFFEG